MTPKPRTSENAGLPRRWRFKHGAYYYRPKEHERAAFDGRSEFRLGATLAEAHRAFSERVQWIGETFRMDQLCDRYALEVVPKKAPATQRSNTRSLERIRKAFDRSPVAAVEPVHIYQFRDAVGLKFGQKTANLDLEVLSHMFTKAIEWGSRRDHPMTGKKVVKFSIAPRDRYVEDWELGEAMQVAPPLVRLYVPIKLLTGLRKGEILSIRLADLREDGIHVQRTKGGRPAIYEWGDRVDESGAIIPGDLRQAVELVKAARKKVTGLHLFCNRKGQPYIKEDGTTSGFDSIWQRFMAKALAETKLAERFTEHDLRAKVGSEAENLARAQQLLGHRSAAVTMRVYRRKAERIKPAGA